MGPLELLGLCIGESQDREWAEPGPSEALSALAARVTAALCFRETNCSEIPVVPVISFGVDALPIHALLSLGRDALGVARPVALAAGSIHPYAVLVHLNGSGVICALDGPYLWVFEIGGRAEYGEVMAHLQARSRSRR